MAGRRRRYRKQDVLEAIRGSKGIVSTVAQRLGCNWHTAQRYIQRWKETRDAFEAERETVLDTAESVLIRSIEEGNTQDAKWLLSRLGKHRGYGDQVDVTSGGEALQVVFRWIANDRGGDRPEGPTQQEAEVDD